MNSFSSFHVYHWSFPLLVCGIEFSLKTRALPLACCLGKIHFWQEDFLSPCHYCFEIWKRLPEIYALNTAASALDTVDYRGICSQGTLSFSLCFITRCQYYLLIFADLKKLNIWRFVQSNVQKML